METEFVRLAEGALPQDINHNPIQVASTIQMFDANPTEANIIFSPIAGAPTVKKLFVPKNAAVCVVRAIDQLVKVGTNKNLSAATKGNEHYSIPAGQAEAIPCLGLPFLFILEDAATATIPFRFEMLKKKLEG